MKKRVKGQAVESKLKSAFELMASEEWMKTIIEESRDAIFISDIDSRFVMINKAACVLTGYSKQELLGMRIPDLHEPADLHAYNKFHTRIIGGEEILSESRILRKDGSKVPTEFNNKRINIDGAVFVHTSARDVTYRQTAETELRESEEKYRTLTESSPAMIYVVDEEGFILYVNSNAARQFGRGAIDISGKHLSDLFPLETAKRNLLRVKEVFKTGLPQVTEVEMEFPGRKVWLEVKLSPLFDQKKRVTSVLGLSTDISERKSSELLLKASEEKFRTLFNNLPDIVCLISPEGEIISLNPAFEKTLGWKDTDWLNKHFKKLVHPEDLGTALSSIKHILAGDTPYIVEIRLISSSGEYKTVEVNPSQLKIGDVLIGVLGIVRDITERKLIEKQILDSEDRYKDLFENSSDLICMHDLEGNLTMVNYASEKLSGFTKQELLGMRIQDLIEPKFRSQFNDYMNRLNSEGSAAGTMIIKTKAGERRYWLYNNSLRREGVEKPVVRGIAKDITEQKLAEIKLQKNKDELQKFFDDDIAAVFLTSVKGHILECNKTFLKVFGIRSIEEALKINIRDYYVNPSDRDELIRLVSDRGRVEQYELDFQSSPGHQVHTLLNAIGVFNDAGQLEKIKGYIVDITNWKKPRKKSGNSQGRWIRAR